MPAIETPTGISLAYETVGDPADPPLLLVAGYGTQLIAWPRRFSEQLAAGGRFVIEFDNRDCGLSSKLEGAELEMDAVSAAVAAGDFARASRARPLHAERDGGRRGRPARRRSGSSAPTRSAPRWAG